MGVRIEGWAREVLERPGVFGTLATLQPDGSPLQAVVWFDLRGDDHRSSTPRSDGTGPRTCCATRASASLVEQGYEWVSIRGVAEALADPEQAQADIAGHGAPLPWRQTRRRPSV